MAVPVGDCAVPSGRRSAGCPLLVHRSAPQFRSALLCEVGYGTFRLAGGLPGGRSLVPVRHRWIRSVIRCVTAWHPSVGGSGSPRYESAMGGVAVGAGGVAARLCCVACPDRIPWVGCLVERLPVVLLPCSSFDRGDRGVGGTHTLEQGGSNRAFHSHRRHHRRRLRCSLDVHCALGSRGAVAWRLANYLGYLRCSAAAPPTHGSARPPSAIPTRVAAMADDGRTPHHCKRRKGRHVWYYWKRWGAHPFLSGSATSGICLRAATRLLTTRLFATRLFRLFPVALLWLPIWRTSMQSQHSHTWLRSDSTRCS